MTSHLACPNVTCVLGWHSRYLYWYSWWRNLSGCTSGRGCQKWIFVWVSSFSSILIDRILQTLTRISGLKRCNRLPDGGDVTQPPNEIHWANVLPSRSDALSQQPNRESNLTIFISFSIGQRLFNSFQFNLRQRNWVWDLIGYSGRFLWRPNWLIGDLIDWFNVNLLVAM